MKAQVIFEIIFDIAYLSTILTVGTIIISKAKNNRQILLFGIMSILLWLWDAFHLVPRIYALSTNWLESHFAILGLGKRITSISMTIFYVLLFHIAKIRYKINNKSLTIWVYLLAIIRIALCLFPQNQRLLADPSYIRNIYRNIPFAILGILMIILFYKYSKKQKDSEFKYMRLAILLSFAFYLPVVLRVHKIPTIWMLMIPKTCAYVWIVWMGYRLIRK